jgi:hypothetical protein
MEDYLYLSILYSYETSFKLSPSFLVSEKAQFLVVLEKLREATISSKAT